MKIPEAAARVINFIEGVCVHTKGRHVGKPFLLHDYQKKFCCDVFGKIKKNGARYVQTAYLEIAKKNGKSEFGAALALYALVADLNPFTGKPEAGAEVYIAASAKHQAARIYKTAKRMVEKSPVLAKRLTSYDTTKTIIRKDDHLSFLQCLSADADTEDGINPHFVIFDELHRQGKRGKDLYDVLEKGMSTRDNPLMISLTTAGIESKSQLCWDLHTYSLDVINRQVTDPSHYGMIFSLDPGDDWRDESCWLKANPALGGNLPFKSIESMRNSFKKAIRLPSQQSAWRRFETNEWMSDEEKWIPLHEWDHEIMSEPFNVMDLKGCECFGGLDLSAVNDLTAFVLLFPFWDLNLFYIHPVFWIPGLNLIERSEKEGVDWALWASLGYINVIEKKSIDLRVIRRDINELAKIFDFKEIAFDPWGAGRLDHELEEDGFTMIRFNQSFKQYSMPSKLFENYVLNRNFRHGGHPVLRYCVDCVSMKRNNFDEIAPVKPDRLKSKKRIDGVVGSIMGLDRMERHKPEDLEGFLADPVIVG